MAEEKLSFDPAAIMPVELLDTRSGFDDGIPERGLGLCLSGGGFRGMLFHAGALWRLNQAGILPQLDRISGVSGGSIIAAVLGANWSKLDFNKQGVAHQFQEGLIKPIRDFASQNIDVSAIVGGLLLPGSATDRVIAIYRRHLYGDKTLQDLPDKPQIVINAFNVQSGALWRFSKPYMADYLVGRVENPDLPLAVAVGASTAFPPYLSPLRLRLEEDAYIVDPKGNLQQSPYTTDVHLSDGGVYDNLGLETVWKRYDTILVSDGGGQVRPEATPARDWPRHLIRILTQIDNQVRSLRKRQVIDAYQRYTQHMQQGRDPEDPLFRQTTRRGTYWGIRSNIKNYELPTALDCPQEKTLRLADIPTRMKRLEPELQEQLINWGYAICDTALRKHYNSTLPAPDGFPYPSSGVG